MLRRASLPLGWYGCLRRMLGLVRLKPGSIFAQDFRVIAPIAEGGMGVVYRVEQLSTREERALKVLKPNLLSDARSRDRFAQEATLGSNIPSDHVVKVISAGVDDETGVPWIAMELLRGDTLGDVIRVRGPLAPSEVLGVCRQLCHALAAAHRAGVVHRDLKPENIFIGRSLSHDERSMVKLLDFGLAKVLQESETTLSATSVVGSPLWMAPEQIRRGRIQPSTDVWALGLIAFWMLTGRYYWLSAQGGASAEALLHEKLYEPLVPPSRRAAALGVPCSLPRGFDEWFRRCVAREPSARFRDAGEALAALVPVLDRGLPGFRTDLRAALGGAVVATALFALALVVGSEAQPRPARTFVAHDAAAVPLRASTEDAAVPTRPSTLPEIVVRAPLPRGRRRPQAVASATTSTLTAPHVLPRAEGYAFRARRDWDVQCPTPGMRRAWQVTPDWYTRGRMRIEAHEQSLRAEERRLARSADAATHGELSQELARRRRQLDDERRAFEALVERNARAEPMLGPRLAEQAGCRDNGLYRDASGVYAVWCCP